MEGLSVRSDEKVPLRPVVLAFAEMRLQPTVHLESTSLYLIMASTGGGENIRDVLPMFEIRNPVRVLLGSLSPALDAWSVQTARSR